MLFSSTAKKTGIAAGFFADWILFVKIDNLAAMKRAMETGGEADAAAGSNGADSPKPEKK